LQLGEDSAQHPYPTDRDCDYPASGSWALGESMMRNLMIAVCGLALLLGAAEKDKDKKDADKKTIEGELVDTHCYAAAAAMGEKHAACGAKCAKSGIPVAVLVDGKAWTLSTNPRPLADAVGKTVRVTGIQSTEAQCLVPDKVEVKDGDSW